MIHQVNVGVALTVGPLSSMKSRLEIVRVAPVGIGGSARLLVSERNVGDTFLKATGQAICLAGKVRHAYPLSSDTVLPGNTTTLAVNTPGLPSGADIHCRVVLNYVGADGATAPASWRGIVKIPKLVKPHVVQTGPGSYAAVPKAHVPRWAIAVIAAGGTIVLALLVVIVLLLRRAPARHGVTEPDVAGRHASSRDGRGDARDVYDPVRLVLVDRRPTARFAVAVRCSPRTTDQLD